MEQARAKYVGTCHCGAVRFFVEADLSEGGTRCNCRICTKLDTYNRLLKPEAFELERGEADLATYGRSTAARRYFCKTCGVQCFGRGNIPELGGEFVSVNLNCLEGVELRELPVAYWDGRNDNWHAGPRATPWPILRDSPR